MSTTFQSPLRTLGAKFADAIAWRVAAHLHASSKQNTNKAKPAKKALGYIGARENIEGAASAGKGVNQYIQDTYGWTEFLEEADRFVSYLEEHRFFDEVPGGISTCEIGPGSGRHLEALLKTGRFTKYDVYEGDPEWARWLGETFPATSIQPLEGELLASTEDESMDLVHAHATMVYLPFLNVMSYLRDSARVLRPGGWLVFDVFTEDCMLKEDLVRWLATEKRYPQLLPREYLIERLSEWGLEFTSSSRGLDKETEYLFFKRVR